MRSYLRRAVADLKDRAETAPMQIVLGALGGVLLVLLVAIAVSLP